MSDFQRKEQITLSDICSIKIRPKGSKAENWDALQNLFLLKIFSHDQQARNLEFPPSPPYESYSDLLISVIERCDEFALQTFYEKLLDNQFSIPIVCSLNGHLTFFLWALRTIKKTWKKDKETAIEKFISRHPMKTISFCRVGDLNRYSKSVIINTIMSTCQGADDNHSFFLDKENDNGLSQIKGSIEACFFCPDARDGEIFKDIHCIYNLRGDALAYPKQFQFLLEVSSLLVIISEQTITEEERKRFTMGKLENVIFVVLNKNAEQDTQETESQKNTFFASNSNLKTFCKKFVLFLSERVGEKVLSIEEHSKNAKKIGFLIDEEKEECNLGKQNAGRFLKEISKFDQSKRKEQVVPLQGEYWNNWAKMDKEESRRKQIGTKELTNYIEEVNSKKIKYRQNQRDLGVSTAMKIFLDEIKKPQDESKLKFFIDWCQLFLNWSSQEQIFELKQQFQLAKDGQAKQSSKTLETYDKTDLCKISEKLFQLSFGLENVFRELGQIYEANLSTKEYNFLPKCMAKMMLLGYSLEIMDGDVSHVPATWVKEVLRNLEAELKPNSKVMVMSVLGIQSCGKSTLLNEMFGCKFPVSAGRCTKGVFIQLVPVETELRKKMKCDYFLVMDAEGLRSPNLSGEFCHDNEIATFVTFLSDLTLVTFQGDTLSTEMKEILEIVIHAYARMKKVDVKSFVHLMYLRVSGHDREDKNSGVEQKVIGELDIIANKIASEEDRKDLNKGFSSIFQSLKEKYPNLSFEKTFPNLWIGNMRVPESRFGQVAGKLRDSFCAALIDQQEKSFKASEISFFSSMLENTWKAIKEENFVLNFKNTRQIDSFRNLEKEYYRLQDGVFQKFLCQSSLAGQTEDKWLSFKSKERAIDEAKSALDISNILKADIENVEAKLRDFIHTLQDPNYASQHLNGFMNDLDIAVNHWITRNQNNVEEKIKIAYTKQNLESAKDYKIVMKEKTKHLAERLRKHKETNLSEEDIDCEFKKWFEYELTKAQGKDKENIKEDSFDKVQSDTIQILQEKIKILKVPQKALAEARTILKEIKASKENEFSFEMKPQAKSFLSKLLGRQSGDDNAQINLRWRTCEKNLLDFLHRETSKTYDNLNTPELVKQMIDTTVMEIDQFKDKRFLTNEFKWNALVQMYGFSVKRIAVVYDDYIRKASHVYNLQEMRQSLYSDFVKDCKQVNQSLRMGEKFVDQILKDTIIFHIQNSKGSAISDDLKNTPELSTKSDTSFRILEELLDANTHTIISFFNDYKSYSERWISEKVLTHCMKDNYLQNWLMEQITNCIEKITQKLNDSVSSGKGKSLETWYDVLASSLKDEKDATGIITIKTSKGDFIKLLSTSDQPDISAFVTETKGLINEPAFKKSIFEAILDQSNNTLPDHKWIKVLNWLEYKPLERLQNHLIGCTDQCPLCGAICDGGVACKTEASRTKAHSAEIHLPSGICGRHWTSSKKLCTEICSVEILGTHTFLISSQWNRDRFGIKDDNPIPYTQANETFKGIWKISPDSSAEATRFWKFLFVKHQQQIAEIQELEEAENIPPSWYNITREEALENLKYLIS